MMKTTIVSIVCVLWLALAAPAHAKRSYKPIFPGDGSALLDPDNNDGLIGEAVYADEVAAAWRQSNYAYLDELFGRWAKPAERFDDGRMHLMAVNKGFAIAFQRNRERKDWEQDLAKIGEWREKNPASTAVDIVQAIILHDWAWSARGNGYARTVTPEGWKLFGERLQRAEAVLFNSKERSSSNPLWYAVYLDVAQASNWDSAEFRALYDAAIARFPDFDALYFKMLWSLQPRWGGSIEESEAYIAEVVKQTQAQQGKVMYARLYWYLAGISGGDFSLFEDSAADWADMKEGFEQMLKATPKSNWNLNNFASFACRAGDADTYRKLRKRIGDEMDQDAWPSTHTMEICDARLLKKI